MKKLNLNQSGELNSNDLQQFGGAFSFFEKLKMKGIGSNKLIYRSGVEYFDEIANFNKNEISFLSFELMQNGLILRLRRNQQIRAIGFELKKLVAIELVGYRVEIKYKKYGRIIKKIVHRGEVKLKSSGENEIYLEVLVREYKDIVQFFEKPILKEKFLHSINTAEPEKDYGHLAFLMGDLADWFV